MMRSRMVTALRAASGRRVALAAAALAVAAAPGLAQQQYGERQTRSTMPQGETQVGRSYQRQMEQDRFGRQGAYGQDQFGRQGASGQGEFGMQGRRPMGRQAAFPQRGWSEYGSESDQWVRVAYDFDNDGSFDSETYIYMADLEQASAMSDRRREFESTRGAWQGQGQGRMQPRMQPHMQEGMQPMQRQRRPQQFQQQRWYEQDQRFQQQQRWEGQDRGFQQHEQDPWYRSQQGGFREFESEPGRQWEQQQFRQQHWQDQQGRQGWDDYYGRSQASGMRSLRGELKDITTVRLQGESDPHLIATVESESGQVEHVDLGSKRQLDRINLREGDRVTLMGTPGYINNRPVLLANRIGADGRTITVSRGSGQGQTLPTRYEDRFDDQGFEDQWYEDQEFQDQGFQGRNLQGMNLEGQNLRCEVVSTWEDTLEHDGEEHTLAIVSLDRGENIVVDLGPTDDLDDLDIDEGDQITLRGLDGSIDGRPALLAESVSTDDDRVRIDRGDDRVQLRTQRGIDRYLRDLDR